jgi:hypothetical protein
MSKIVIDPFMVVVECFGGTFWKAVHEHEEVAEFIETHINAYEGVGETGVQAWHVFYTREDFDRYMADADYKDDHYPFAFPDEWERCMALAERDHR